MKKKFAMKELDCANCAAKMEAAIAKLDGVNQVTISFMTQKMTLDAVDERFDDIVAQAQQVIRRIEPDCSIVVK